MQNCDKVEKKKRLNFLPNIKEFIENPIIINNLFRRDEKTNEPINNDSFNFLRSNATNGDIEEIENENKLKV